MLQNKTTNFIITSSVLITTLFSIRSFSYLNIDNTYIWWLTQFTILFLILKYKNLLFFDLNNKIILPIVLFTLWNITCIIRGTFIADDYWEWKALVNTTITLLLPLSIYITTNTYLSQKIHNAYVKVIIPLFFLLLPFLMAEGVGHYLVPVSIFLLFFPFLTFKQRCICLGMASFVFMANLGARSNVLKFLVPMVLSLGYYFKIILSTSILKYTRVFFLVIPLVLLVLGVTNVFNVFKLDEYVKADVEFEREDIAGGKEYLTSDTRTFIYAEVIASALKYDYLWMGRTPARGYESPYFGPSIDKDLGVNKMERHGSEVSILNFFTWNGIVGVILYAWIFIKGTYLALYKSRSRIMKIVGVYLAFRWAYAWVEDFTIFNLSYFYLWAVIGMCYSKAFRSMTDSELKNWVRGIFDVRYRKAIVKAQRVQLRQN